MDIEAAKTRLIRQLGTEIRDERVLRAMASVPRERFVPGEYLNEAYEDKPLPIGYGQTISQPYIIALMTQALALTGCEKVLEVGTGCGYQAAILAQLCRLVITVERVPALAETARKTLDSLGYENIVVHLAEDNLGWRPDAPYGAIIVTAAAPAVPAELISQLAFGGRMVIPVGSRWMQELYKITRRKNKNVIENLGGCRFVCLIGKDAWLED